MKLRPKLLTALSLSIVFFVSAKAQAAEIRSFELDADTTLIFFIGDVEAGDAEVFRREAAKHAAATVLLESAGGSTIDAIEIGEAIRLRSFGTLVINGANCFSACALIWLAGSPRALSKSAIVGFHATYVDKAGQRMESGVGNALVGRYLTLLNLPLKAIIFATQSSPESLAWLGAANYQDFGIETVIVDDLDVEDDDETGSPPVNHEEQGSISAFQVSPIVPTIEAQAVQSQETTVWGEADQWITKIDHTLGDGCFIMRYYPDGTIFRIGNDVRFGTRSYYLLLANQDWASLKVGDEFLLQFRFDQFGPWDVRSTVAEIGAGETVPVLQTRFTEQEFWQELSVASELSITRDGRFVTKLPLDGAQIALASLRRCQASADKAREARDPFAD